MKLILKKEISIDIDGIKARINTKDLYDDKERKCLLKAVDLFEKGKFKQAIAVIKDMPDEWEGYMDQPIYETLVEFQRGAELTIV